jgi:hypothetical protein
MLSGSLIRAFLCSFVRLAGEEHDKKCEEQRDEVSIGKKPALMIDVTLGVFS